MKITKIYIQFKNKIVQNPDMTQNKNCRPEIAMENTIKSA